MDEDEEINIVGDPNFLNCDYTVHPQWLLDRPSTNPDCWYNNSTSNRSREDSDQEPIGHITTENSITDESGWTEKEKTLLERGIEIFGKSPLRLSQFIGTKTPSEIKYYLKSFYMELHPTHFVRNSVRKLSDDFLELENILIDSQIPCTSEQIVEIDIQNENIRKRRKINTSKEIVRNNIKIPSHKQQNSKFNIIPNKQRVESGKSKLVNKSISRKNIINNDSKSNKLTDLSLEGEIVYMKKTSESSDSDVEIDIEDKCEDNNVQKDAQQIVIEKTLNECSPNGESSEIKAENEMNASDDADILNQLSSLDIPRFEVKLDKNIISGLEKFIFSEFFTHNISIDEKSLENYLKLRNHIIFSWTCKKPNYLTKGDIQKGFKPSVRSTLCKIHNFLEQIGVINYGCGRVRYIRPMHKIFKNTKMENVLKNSTHPKRFKKKFLHNGEGGCTVSHGAHGEIIETTVINKDPVNPKLKAVKKQPTYLIHCKPFSCDYKYKVKLHLSTLLLMDFHAHSAVSEVMGLIGGTWSQSTKLLSITHYEPCKNLASSTTHCDMCPVSQAESAERIHDMELNLLGWFHSHPMFAPEPSQQDLDTQKGLQKWIGNEKPCVGIILSPFNRPTALTPSDYRCLIVDKLENDERLLPYKFKVEIVSENFNLDRFIANVSRIYNFVVVNGDYVDEKYGSSFQQPYVHDKSMTFMEKFVSSARLTLERYFSEQLCQKIVKGIINVCNKPT